VGPSANLTELTPCARLYQKACGENGHGEGEIALFRYVFVADSTREAINAAGGPFIQALIMSSLGNTSNAPNARKF
jgi:hypothetical protein